MKFGRYLASVHKLPVLYVSPEEFGRMTFREKVKEQQLPIADIQKTEYWEAENGMLVFTRSFNSLPPGKTVGDFKVVFIDSADKMRWKLSDFEEFCSKYPNMIKIITKQTTKEGDFKGGQEWAHEVDIEVEVRNRIRIFHKNRNDADFNKKRDKLLFEDRVRQKTDRVKINQRVKESTDPEMNRPVVAFIPDTVI